MQNKSKGLFVLILSNIFFGMFGVYTRFISGHFNPFILSFFREGLSVLIISLFIFLKFSKWEKVESKDKANLFIMGLLSGIANIGMFYAYSHLPITFACFTIFSISTIVSWVYGIFIFKEKLNLFSIVPLVLTLIGISIMFSINLNNIDILGLIGAVVLAICISSSGIFAKNLKGNYDGYQIYLVTCIVASIMNLLISISIKEGFPSLTFNSSWIWLGIFALSAVLGNGLYLLGIRLGTEISVVSIIIPLQNVVTAISGLLILGDIIGTKTIIGGIFIIGATLIPYIKEKYLVNLKFIQTNAQTQSS